MQRVISIWTQLSSVAYFSVIKIRIEAISSAVSAVHLIAPILILMRELSNWTELHSYWNHFLKNTIFMNKFYQIITKCFKIALHELNRTIWQYSLAFLLSETRPDWNCCQGPSNKLYIPQIEAHSSSFQYPLINYLALNSLSKKLKTSQSIT